MTTLLIEDPIFLRHLVPTTHPERPDRLLAIGRALGQDKFKGLIRKTSRPADLAVLTSTHPESHVDKIRKAIPDMGVVQIETDRAHQLEEADSETDADQEPKDRGDRAHHQRLEDHRPHHL